MPGVGKTAVDLPTYPRGDPPILARVFCFYMQSRGASVRVNNAENGREDMNNRLEIDSVRCVTSAPEITRSVVEKVS